MKPNVLVASQSCLKSDPRPNRMIRALLRDFNVTCAGTAPPDISGCNFVKLPRRKVHRAPIRNRSRKILRTTRLFAGLADSVYWSQPIVLETLNVLSKCKADLAWVHDLELLPVAIRTTGFDRVGFDAHEYFPSQYEDSWRWRLAEQKLQKHLVNRYIPEADVVTTVSQGLANQYSSDCGVVAALVPSMPDYVELEPTAPSRDGDLALVYHGKANENRGIEELIRMAHLLDERFSITFVLVGGSSQYRQKLEALIAATPRVTMELPVPLSQIAAATNKFDIGLCAIPPATFNLKHCLPNKLFEMIQARLAIVSWPSPDISRIVHQRGVGIVARDYGITSLAMAINSLTSDRIRSFKNNSHAAARSLSFETASELMINLTHGALATLAAAA